MNKLNKYFKGDKSLWVFIILLSILSFLPVYSASSNLVYTVGTGTIIGHLFKHATILIIGLLITYFLQFIDYRWFWLLTITFIFFASVILFITLLQGNKIGGINASRWISIPVLGIGIQPSTIASQILLIYIAKYLAKNRNSLFTLKKSILNLMIPIFLITGLIIPANGSTAIILFISCIIILYIGGFPFKYLFYMIFTSLCMVFIFMWIALHTNFIANSRVNTWISRIEKFTNNSTIESYQVLHAKAAIARGIYKMSGPGKSVFKQTLPQSSSDFIFAIIVEEYGILGAITLISIYMLILIRICIIASKIETIFGSLLVFSVGLPIVFQALVNMAVAVNLIPVTGQPLPMISYGGTSIWMTCISFGIILSVSTQIKYKKVYNEP